MFCFGFKITVSRIFFSFLFGFQQLSFSLFSFFSFFLRYSICFILFKFIPLRFNFLRQFSLFLFCSRRKFSNPLLIYSFIFYSLCFKSGLFFFMRFLLNYRILFINYFSLLSFIIDSLLLFHFFLILPKTRNPLLKFNVFQNRFFRRNSWLLNTLVFFII